MKLAISSFLVASFIILIVTLLMGSPHLLMMLLFLEAAMLMSMLLFITISCTNNMYFPQAALILLTLGACEASLGLSLMVCMSRHCGSNMLSSTSLAKC